MSGNRPSFLKRLHQLTLALAIVVLLLACRPWRKATPTIAPTSTERPPILQTATVTVSAQAAITPTAFTPSPSPSPTEEPTATATVPPNATPTSQQPTATPPLPTDTPSPTPRIPDAGPLPARWTEVDLSLPGGGVFYPVDLTPTGDGERAYVIGRCVPEPRYQGALVHGCLATIDLASGQVLRTVEMPIGYDAQLTLAGGVAYLHPTWVGDLYALDAGALAAGAMPTRQILSEVRAVAHDGQDTTYAVTRSELVRLSPDAASVPIDSGYDDNAIALAASPRYVFRLGYSTLQVFTPELKRLAEIEVRELNPRAMVLDATQDWVYIGGGSGLWAIDADGMRLQEVPVQVDGDPLRNIEWLILDPSAERLWARVRSPNDWYGGTAVVQIEAAGDAPIWPARTLFSTLKGQIGDALLDEERDRLLLLSYVDHALIPVDLDSDRLSPRIPVGIELQEVVLDPVAERLLVSDSAGWIHALDRRTYTPMTKVYGGRAISLDEEHRRLYAGDPRLRQVTAFDADSLEPLWQADLAGNPRAHPTADQVVVVSRRFDLLDGATGQAAGRWRPDVGTPAEECLGCFFTIASEAYIDAQRGLSMTTTYTPWPGKPTNQESIDYDPAAGRAVYSLLTGGYVHMSSIGVYADLGALQRRDAPILSLEGLSGQVALDPAARRLYVTRGDILFVLNSETLNRLGRVETDGWEPQVTAIDSELGRLYTPATTARWWCGRGRGRRAPRSAARRADRAHPHRVRHPALAQLCRRPHFAGHGRRSAVPLYRRRRLPGSDCRVGCPLLVPTTRWSLPPFRLTMRTTRPCLPAIAFGDTHGEGVYCSTDGGDTWSMCSTGLVDLRVRRVVPSPSYAQNHTLLAYSRTREGESLHRSADGARSWELIQRQVSWGTPPLPVPEQVFPIADPLPQFRCQFRGQEGVVCERSADGGLSWEPLSTAQFHIDSLVGTALSPEFESDGLVYWITQGAVYRYNDHTGTGEISTLSPLYGVRDYTNGFTAIALAAMDQGGPRLFLGTADGQFLSYPANALGWEKVWPLLDPTPAPTPTPCALAADGRFGLPADSAERLGCAAREAGEQWVASQPFERGHMFWLTPRPEESAQVIILSDDDAWVAHADTWAEGQPDRDPGLTPPQGLYQPVRGFGKVWREQLGGQAAEIGWAREPERGHTALVQPFASGLLVRLEDGTTYALYADGVWQTFPYRTAASARPRTTRRAEARAQHIRTPPLPAALRSTACHTDGHPAG